MSKGKTRKAAQAGKTRRKSAAYVTGGGTSRYAERHRGGGNTRPGGMWLVWSPGGTPGSVTREDLRAADEDRRTNLAESEAAENARKFPREWA